MNSIKRGYLCGASLVLTKACNSAFSAVLLAASAGKPAKTRTSCSFGVMRSHSASSESGIALTGAGLSTVVAPLPRAAPTAAVTAAAEESKALLAADFAVLRFVRYAHSAEHREN